MSIKEEKRDRGTFLVKILYQQNNSWQGEVLWAEENQKQHFRSTLELLRLIDDAMDAGDGEGLTRTWERA